MELLPVPSIPTAESPYGLWLPEGRPPKGGAWQLPGYREGLFELQDEGSQLVALATEALPGDTVLDYCAGRGGKTWILAHLVAPSGRVVAWDVCPELRLQLAGGRLSRAGEGLVEVRAPCEADVVLVDAPCSSSGVLRRHPSQRWALDLLEVTRLAKLQLQILREAAEMVREGGRLVYATCSLIEMENEGVAREFEASSDFQPWPFPNGRRGGSHGSPTVTEPFECILYTVYCHK